MTTNTLRSSIAGALGLTAAAFGTAAHADSTLHIMDITTLEGGKLAEEVSDFLSFGHYDDFDPTRAKFVEVDLQSYNDAMPRTLCGDFAPPHNLITTEETEDSMGLSIGWNASYHRAVIGARLNGSEEVHALPTDLQPAQTGIDISGAAYAHDIFHAEGIFDPNKIETRWMLITNKAGEFEGFFMKGENGETLAFGVGPDTPKAGEQKLQRRGFCYTGPNMPQQ